MKLGRLEPLTYFQIWQPRYHDKRVLLSAQKVKSAKTKFAKIHFTKAPSMAGDWVISIKKIKAFPIQTNSSIQCYAVPLSELQPLELTNDERELW